MLPFLFLFAPNSSAPRVKSFIYFHASSVFLEVSESLPKTPKCPLFLCLTFLEPPSLCVTGRASLPTAFTHPVFKVTLPPPIIKCLQCFNEHFKMYFPLPVPICTFSV